MGILILIIYSFFSLPPTPKSLDELTKIVLNGEDFEEKEKAIVEITSRGKEAIPHLRKIMVKGREPRIRGLAIMGLGNLKDRESLPVFLDLLDDPSSIVRGRAAAAFSHIMNRHFPYQANGPNREKVEAEMRWHYEKAVHGEKIKPGS